MKECPYLISPIYTTNYLGVHYLKDSPIQSVLHTWIVYVQVESGCKVSCLKLRLLVFGELCMKNQPDLNDDVWKKASTSIERPNMGYRYLEPSFKEHGMQLKRSREKLANGFAATDPRIFTIRLYPPWLSVSKELLPLNY